MIKKKNFHTDRHTCTNLLPSLALLDVPEDHGRGKKKRQTKSAKSRNIDQRHEGQRDQRDINLIKHKCSVCL